MSAVRAIPEGFHTITPSIVCKNAAKAIDFYKEVFHAKELNRMAGPGGSIGHAELQFGDSRLMLSDEFPGMATAPGANSPPSSYLFVYSDNVDATAGDWRSTSRKSHPPRWSAVPQPGWPK